MTLNGHFALKSGSSWTSNGLAFWLSEKTVRKFAQLRIYCQRQKCIPRCTGDNKRNGVIHWCSPNRKRQTSELYSHSQFSHMLFTSLQKISKILDGQGRARREAARRRKSECKVNLGNGNSYRSNGS